MRGATAVTRIAYEPVTTGGGLRRPLGFDTATAVAIKLARGVSDHPFRPLGLPGPRPRMWSLTPRCLCLSRRGSSWDAGVREASEAFGSTS